MTDSHSNYLERDHDGSPQREFIVALVGDEYSYYRIYRLTYPDETQYLGIRRTQPECEPEVELIFNPWAARTIAEYILRVVDTIPPPGSEEEEEEDGFD